jgi:hypothetical protein
VDGKFTVSASTGAGIGSGHAYDFYVPCISRVDNLVILGGVFDVTSVDGAGIGSGFSRNLEFTDIVTLSIVRNLTIVDGLISARSVNGAGIGSGRASRGNSTVLNLTIMNGDITASSSVYGAGIGSGYAEDDYSYSPPHSLSEVANLTIVGGCINATGKSGIGRGSVDSDGSTEVLNLTIAGGVINPRSSGWSPEIDIGSPLHISLNATITILSRSSPLFRTTPLASGDYDLAIIYDTTIDSQSENFPFLESTMYIQVGSVNLPFSGIWDICAWSTSYSHCFKFNSEVSRSFLVSVRSNELYHLSAASGSIAGQFESEGLPFFYVSYSPVFLSDPTFVQMGTATPKLTAFPTGSPAMTDTPGDTPTASPGSLSSPSQSPLFSPSLVPTPQANPLSTGAIVGITIGGLGIIGIACVLLYMYRKRTRRPEYDTLNSSMLDN